MNLGNIKSQRLAVLEQACERYAIMAFETLNGRLAIGLKSITYSYKSDERREDGGTFTASFTPWNVSDCPKEVDRIVDVAWYIQALNDGRWDLSDGMASVQGEPGLAQVLWGKDAGCMAFRFKDKIVHSVGSKHCSIYNPRVIV